MEKIDRFNVRVYGLLTNLAGELLLTDERISGHTFTKFPGGGLEFGEGPAECLVRECMEEMNQPVRVVEHFYTTDFFQQSAFRKADQLLSIYYRIALDGPQQFSTSQTPFDFAPGPENAQSFRWISLEKLRTDDVTWPVDKVVVQRLLEGPYAGNNIA